MGVHQWHVKRNFADLDDDETLHVNHGLQVRSSREEYGLSLLSASRSVKDGQTKGN